MSHIFKFSDFILDKCSKIMLFYTTNNESYIFFGKKIIYLCVVNYVNLTINIYKMRRIILIVVAALLSVTSLKAQHSTYYYQRATHFEQLPTSKQDIIFLGNSITDGAEWVELLNDKNVKNRGISGDVTEGVLDRLSVITKGQPSKLFLMIGINDLARGISADTIACNTIKIVSQLHKESPRTQIYVQSVLPVSDHYGMFKGHSAKGAEVKVINSELQKLAEDNGYTYIDLYSHLIDKSTDKLDNNYSNDGLHLLGDGYKLWVEILKPYLK